MRSCWPNLPLGEIFEIARGGSPRPIEAYFTDDPAGVPWVLISDATGSSKYIDTTQKRIRPEGVTRSRKVYPGDFLLTNSMSFGRPYIMRTSGCIHDGWLVLQKKNAEIVPDFFYYLLGSPVLYSEFERRAAGATVKNLNIDLVKSVSVPLPPAAEQRRIAAILDQAEALRAKRRESIQRLSTLARAMFLDRFGHPGGNPLGLPSQPLDSLCTRVTVGFVGSMADEYVDSGVPFLRSLNIKRGRIDAEDLKFISAGFHAKLQKSALRPGDVVTVRTGQPGTTAVIPETFAVANCADLIVMTCGSSLDPHYLAEALNLWLGDADSIQGQVGAIQVHFNVARAKELRLPLPGLALQHEFGAQVVAIDHLKASFRASLAKLDDLFASLQHRAFRGEL